MTLAAIAAEVDAIPPYLIKIDTDARELDVIQGAHDLLECTDVFVVETKLYNLPKGKVTPTQIIARIAKAGFAMVELAYIERNQAGFLRIIDFVFARTNSQLFAELSRLSAKPDNSAERRKERLAALKQVHAFPS
jgi:hypothetical protein